MAWLNDGGWLILAGLAAVLGSIGRSTRQLRAALAVAGLLAVAAGTVPAFSPAPLTIGLLLVLINGLALLRLSTGRHDLNRDERLFHDRHLPGIKPAQTRLLLQQGSFAEARTGEELTREGKPASTLYFLIEGAAAVLVNDMIVGRVDAGDLIGEAALLRDGVSSATVRLASEQSRLWFIDRDELHRFLMVHPDIATELQSATLAALRDKLDLSNRARSDG